MRRHKILRSAMLSVSVVLAGGMVLSNGCINTIASMPLCGTVFPWCTPSDQLNLFYPMLEVPDYGADPSCTVPLGCADSDLFDGGEGDNIPPDFPGGDSSEQPTEDQGDGVGGTSGGGGG